MAFKKANKLLAEEIVENIWHDICDRNGLDMDSLDEDIQEEIKEEWVRLVFMSLEKERKKIGAKNGN